MRESCRSRRKRRAFSLLELLAVVTIIGIIATIVIPRVVFHAFSAKEKACLKYRRDLNEAIEKYLFAEGKVPADLSELASSEYYPDAIPKCPAENTVYTIDAATGRIAGHDH